MGYRSEVRCLIYGEPDQLDGFIIGQQLVFNSPVFQHFKENLTKYSVDTAMGWDDANNKFFTKKLHVLDLYGGSWKWYENYPEVQAWMKFMNEAEDHGLSYEFIRIGEEYTDIEVETGGEAPMIYQFLSVSSPTIMEDIPKAGDLTL